VESFVRDRVVARVLVLVLVIIIVSIVVILEVFLFLVLQHFLFDFLAKLPEVVFDFQSVGDGETTPMARGLLSPLILLILGAGEFVETKSLGPYKVRVHAKFVLLRNDGRFANALG
jgi:hypothetical protein